MRPRALTHAALFAAIAALYPTGALREAVVVPISSAAAEGRAVQPPLHATASPKGPEDGKALRFDPLRLVDLTQELLDAAPPFAEAALPAALAPDALDDLGAAFTVTHLDVRTIWAPPRPVPIGGGGALFGGPRPTAVPEPGAWTLMILGAALVGGALRRAHHPRGDR